MAEQAYHGADATLSIQTESGTSINVGGLRNVNIVPSVEVDELYTADSILREAAKQRNASVLVEASLAKVDVAMIQQWLGGSGASSTGFVDTNDLALFEVTATVTPEGGGTNKQAVVEEVYFPEMPVFADVSHDSWEETQISGTGKDLTVTGP